MKVPLSRGKIKQVFLYGFDTVQFLKYIVMPDDIMNFDLPVERSSIIKVIGIGGGGNNAVNHMFRRGIKDVNFVICNTDYQVLVNSPVPVKIQIGETLTEGMGAGSLPEKGKKAASENIKDIMEALGGNTRMVFIAAGMGGGTGTGAAPVIARACKEAGLLTVAVVTVPFRSEGPIRMRNAIAGVNELQNHVDSLLVINNDKLLEIYGNLGISAAFAKADDVLTVAVKGIAEIITVTGYINVDFADVERVMENSGVALMGMGIASGEDRARHAVEDALRSPLLNANDITGAKKFLINITSGIGETELTMDELGEISEYLNNVASEEVEIIQGLTQDESLGDKISVTIVATGFKATNVLPPTRARKVETLPLSGEIVPPKIIAPREENRVQNPDQPSLIFDFEEADQGVFEFKSMDGNSKYRDDIDDMRIGKRKTTSNTIKGGEFSREIVANNIETFEDVPAYVRHSRNLDLTSKVSAKDPSTFTLSTDDEEEGPVFRENNAYLNDNVD